MELGVVVILEDREALARGKVEQREAPRLREGGRRRVLVVRRHVHRAQWLSAVRRDERCDVQAALIHRHRHERRAGEAERLPRRAVPERLDRHSVAGGQHPGERGAQPRVPLGVAVAEVLAPAQCASPGAGERRRRDKTQIWHSAEECERAARRGPRDLQHRRGWKVEPGLRGRAGCQAARARRPRRQIARDERATRGSARNPALCRELVIRGQHRVPMHAQ